VKAWIEIEVEIDCDFSYSIDDGAECELTSCLLGSAPGSRELMDSLTAEQIETFEQYYTDKMLGTNA